VRNLKLYTTAFLITFFYSTQLNGQSKDFIKLNKIYRSGNAEKLIRKADKLRNKNHKNSTANYFLSLAYLQKIKSGDYQIYLSKSIKSLKQAKKYDESLAIWKLLDEEIEFLRIEISNQTNALILTNKSKAKKFYKIYVEIFEDTLSCYSDLFDGSKNDHILIKEIDSNILLKANDIRDSIKAFGRLLVGVPYKWAGVTTKGFDCSGFVMYVYGKVGIKLPHNANQISYLGKEVDEEHAKAGDLILFGTREGIHHRASHVGIIYDILDGELQVIQCVSKGVNICDNFDSYWKSRVMLITNILDSNAADELSQK
jgi:hypothetical protein